MNKQATSLVTGAAGLTQLPAAVVVAAREMQAEAARFRAATTPQTGQLEAALYASAQRLALAALAEAAQQKAGQCALACPACGHRLSRLRASELTVESRFGAFTVRRKLGWCAACAAWHCPADRALGLAQRRTPYVQEMAALFKTKLPVAEAAATLHQATGLKLAPATLDRVARQAGEQALARRAELDELASQPGPTAPAPAALPPASFTLVIEIDAWNIRERDDWGQGAALRAQGQTPQRWHWVYAATVFRLSERGQTSGGRPLILSRGYVSTRGGLDALREQLHAEALRQGLGQAARVLVIADGAAWIWNLAADRFKEAVQRLDLYHAKEHLWVVAHALHGEGTPAAKAWLKPLETQLENGQPAQMIARLEEALATLAAEPKAKVAAELAYFKSHAHRMDYADAKARGEPLGSGAIESTCRQYQSRFKQTGAFWSLPGDEGLMCLQTFWRNGRWHLLFPHASAHDPSKN